MSGFRASGYRGGRFTAGGMNFSRSPSRNRLNSFLGLPSDAGLHTFSRTSGISGGRGVVVGPHGAAAGGHVQGPFGGGASRGVAVGPRGNVVGGRAVTGPRGNRYAQGFAAGPRGLHTVSAVQLHTGATRVRTSFHHYGVYGRAWYARYPRAWHPVGWAVGYAWRPATWGALTGWFGYGYYAAPVYYDYGTTVVYQGDNVYVGGQDVGTADQYYQQAENLAGAGVQADAPTNGQWLPLGVFAATQDGNNNANMTFQLAVNKQGVIRGNYTNTAANENQSLTGSVDKKTQRAAWTVGDNKTVVFETGLYNLTKDEAPMLVHFGKDRTEQWMLVRLKQDQQQAGKE